MLNNISFLNRLCWFFLLLHLLLSIEFSKCATLNEKITGEDAVKNDDFNETTSSVNETSTTNLNDDEIILAKDKMDLLVIVCSLFGIGILVFISSVVIWNPIYRKRVLGKKVINFNIYFI